MPGRHAQRRERVLVYVALLLVGLASVWLRAPGLGSSGFASHDVAGITYNAQLLLNGDLPYRESIELKAPGSFYLAAAIAPAQRGVAWVQRLHLLANFWGLATLLVVAATAWRLFGRRAAVVAAALYALHDAHLDSMDANYVTWANLPAALAAWMGLEARGLCMCPATGAGKTSRAKGWPLWLAAGLFAGLAALAKRPAAAVGPALLLMALWPQPDSASPESPTPEPQRKHQRRSSDEGKGMLIRAGALAGGVALAHLPFALHYASQGALSEFVHGYGLSTWGAAYVGANSMGVAQAAREWMMASAHFVGLPLGLALFAAFSWRRSVQPQAARDLSRSLLAWAGLMLLAAAMGFRFYKGYFSTALAPLCVLAAAPWGLSAHLRGLFERKATWAARTVGVVLLAFTLALSARQANLNAHTRADRARPHDAGGRAIVRMIRPELEHGERVWVWGWHLWDVYTYADALSGSRIYKSLGLLTPPNNDTWRKSATPPGFVAGPMADLLIEDLSASRPKWIVLGSTAPSRDFAALQSLLRHEYTLDRRKRLGRVQFWKRRPARAQSTGG